jgi:predicted DNA-binding protein
MKTITVNGKSEVIHVRLAQDKKETLGKIAKRDGRTISGLVSWLINKHLQSEGV